MPRFITVLALVLALAATSTVAQHRPQIISNGQAGISVAPDMARITIGVEHRADLATDALAQMGADISAVMDRMKAVGVAEKDIQTSGLQLDLERDYSASSGGARVVGYVARSNITIAIYDLEILGEILSGVVTDGANQINGLTFDVADRAPHLEMARRSAVADARARARIYADAAEVTLGPLLHLSETGGAQPGPYPMEARATFAQDATPIAAGEITISASVTVTYAIAD